MKSAKGEIVSMQDVKLPESPELLRIAENAIASANQEIQYFTSEVRQLRSSVRSIAMTTIDLLLSNPSSQDVGKRKREVVDQYSRILMEFSNEVRERVARVNRCWMTVDQALGFYLISTGQDTGVRVSDLSTLIDTMIKTRQQIPGTVEEISNLISAIKASAGGLHGLEDAIGDATKILERLNGELDLADSVIQRQIILAKRLHEVLAHS